jgi:hypothetical protein
MSHRRTLVVVPLAILASALACAAAMIAAGALYSGSGPITIAVPFFALYFCWGLAIAVVLGLPSFALFWFFGLVRWWTALASGLGVGALVAFLMSNGPDLKPYPVMAAVGAASAMAFWSVWTKCIGSGNAT